MDAWSTSLERLGEDRVAVLQHFIDDFKTACAASWDPLLLWPTPKLGPPLST
jgi:hypothetical protein